MTGTDELADRKLYCHFPRQRTLADTVGGSFVRDGDFKLIRHWFGGVDREHKYELFDLSTDVSESKNLAEADPERVQAMSLALDRWLAKTNA